jgi:hypothetical protein
LSRTTSANSTPTPRGTDFIEDSYGVAGAHVACLLEIVVEVLVTNHPVCTRNGGLNST